MRSLLSWGKTAVVAAAVLMAAMSGYAAPTVTVLTDKGSYRAGETVELSLGGENHDEPLSVDVYVGLIGRDGALCTLGEAGWGAYLAPWMADVLVPNPFYMAPVAFQWFDIPCVMPPISDAGEYSFAAGLTQQGTLDFVALISFAPFTINPPELHVYVSAETGNDGNDGSRDSPFETITHALASVEGSESRPVTIHVAAGTYSKSTNSETFPLNMKSWVSLLGADAETTILDAQGEADHVICCEDVERLRIESFTITKGQTSLGTGGGLLCTRSSPTIRGNVISGNQARCGAGIYCGEGSSPAIENNTISGNAASSYGGGIYCADASRAAIRNNLIVNNSAHLGGALYYYAESPPTIDNNTITGNRAKYGAGIYCEEASRSFVGRPADSACRAARTGTVGFPERTFDVSDCIIWGNSTSSRYTYDDDGLYRDLYCCSAVYSCIEQEEEGEGNIHDDPMFVSGMFGPYYLDPQSPCVDAGSRSALEAGLWLWTTQVDGLPDLGVVDMGYHRPAALTERPPTAYIDLISPNPMTQGEGTLEFRGHGEGGETFVGYWWLSDLDGYLSDQEDFDILHGAYLTVGTHEISFYVTDWEGGWSEPDIAQLTILPNPREEVFASADTGDDLNYGSELDPFRTVTEALGCVHGTQEKPVTIHVASGTYSASTNGESFPLDMKSWVSVIGQGADTTVLDAEGESYHVITCLSVDNLWIAGFTIRGGNADGRSRQDSSGGGVSCDGSSPIIFGNTLSTNYANDGGAICCQNGSNPVIGENAIEGNSAGDSGGGIYCHESAPIIQNNKIADNEAGFCGAGIFCLEAPAMICENAFSRNSCDSYGGAMYCDSSSCSIENNRIEDNYGRNGVIWCSGCSPAIRGNAITGNNGNPNSGSIRLDESSAIVSNNMISDNTGGGIDCNDGTPTITNNTITGNSSGDYAGGISCTSGSPTIRDCIIWGNGDNLGGCSAKYCCIEDEDSGEGNIHDNPMFVTGPYGDFYLSRLSRCIDAGSKAASEAGLADRTTQVDSSPDTGVVDLGFHYPLAEGDRPSAYIDSILPNPAVSGEDTIAFQGSCSEGGAPIKGYEWYSDIDGILSNEEDFLIPAAEMTIGRHGISYVVWDENNLWSSPALASLDIQPNPRAEVYVNAETGSDHNRGTIEAPLKTITHALASTAGASGKRVTIHVTAGRYSPSSNGETFPIRLKSWVSIMGEGQEVPTIDAEHTADQVIYCDAVNEVTIEGLTICGGGPYDRMWPENEGGGIYCYTSSPTIQNNTITGNTAGYGGGIYCNESLPTIQSNTIMDNSGDGMYCSRSSPAIQSNLIAGNSAGGIDCDESSPTIQNNTIRGNTAGGGISCFNHSCPTISDNTITRNTATGIGGGIFCHESSPPIQNNTITQNSGGIYCYESSPTIESNAITDNSLWGGIYCLSDSCPTISANAIGGNTSLFGGGIYCEQSSPTIQNNVISGNSAELDGGGIYCIWCSPTISDNTLSGNTAEGGGGIYSVNDISPRIIDCIIWGNGDNLYDCSATYCCVESYEPGEGNIHDDPMFVNGPLGDYHLDPDSPCIDAGSRSAEEAGLSDRTTQVDGTPDTGTVDMGFHYPIP